jgi:hypothetical protein
VVSQVDDVERIPECREALHLIDYRALISMNRKYPRAHPMLVDVDLKEGFPDGPA